MPITSSASSIARSWERRSAALEGYMRRATRDATRDVYAESRKNLTKMIYDQPVPSLGDIAREQGIVSFEREKGPERVEIAGRKRKKATAKLGRYITIKGRTFVIPLTAKEERKKAWPRTGNLRRSERWKMESSYVGIIYNDAGYAEARHDKKSRFPAPWRRSAIAARRRAVQLRYRQAVMQAIRDGAVRNPFQG